MPGKHSAKTKRCVKHVMDKGKPASSAWPICVASTTKKKGKKKK